MLAYTVVAGGFGRHGGGRHHGGRGWHYRGGRRWDWYPEPVYYAAGCPPDYAPVIADDGRIYQNACYARMAGAVPIRSAQV